jgi:hypothetical protein
MTNIIFRERLNNIIGYCLKEAQLAKAVNHSGMTGEIRQLLIDQILRPLLPDGTKIGTGKITDRDGNLSAQTDVVIYNSRILPSIMFDEKMGLFPIESVHYAIEIKSCLTSVELNKSIKNGKLLRSLNGEPPHSAIFAFSSDLKTEKESARLISKEKDLAIPLPVNVLCVVGREYMFWKDGQWSLFDDIENYNEVVGFVVGVINTIYQSQFRNINSVPGYYLF